MSRKPDYEVHAMNKATDEKNKVGAAWVNEGGSITIILAPFVVLTAGKELVVSLFPRKTEKPTEG